MGYRKMVGRKRRKEEKEDIGRTSRRRGRISPSLGDRYTLVCLSFIMSDALAYSPLGRRRAGLLMRQEQTHCVMRAGAGLRHQQRGFATLRGGAVPQPSETMAASAVGALISWASTYSDLSAVPKPTNLAFLLTNSFYFAAGLKLRRVRPESVFGDVMIFAGIVSCLYHGTQVVCGPRSPVVMVALAIDYVGAFTAMATTLHRIARITLGGSFPARAVGLGAGAMVSFFKGAQWTAGTPYVVWHSLWHFLSAASVFMVATAAG